MDGDTCRLCSRRVVDLGGMDDAGRVAFMKACSGEVCVTYRLPVGVAIAAAMALGVVATPLAAAAQDEASEIMELVITGGIKDPSQTAYVETGDELAAPELPVVYDEAPATADPQVTSPAGS